MRAEAVVRSESTQSVIKVDAQPLIPEASFTRLLQAGNYFIAWNPKGQRYQIFDASGSKSTPSRIWDRILLRGENVNADILARGGEGIAIHKKDRYIGIDQLSKSYEPRVLEQLRIYATAESDGPGVKGLPPEMLLVSRLDAIQHVPGSDTLTFFGQGSGDFPVRIARGSSALKPEDWVPATDEVFAKAFWKRKSPAGDIRLEESRFGVAFRVLNGQSQKLTCAQAALHPQARRLLIAGGSEHGLVEISLQGKSQTETQIPLPGSGRVTGCQYTRCGKVRLYTLREEGVSTLYAEDVSSGRQLACVEGINGPLYMAGERQIVFLDENGRPRSAFLGADLGSRTRLVSVEEVRSGQIGIAEDFAAQHTPSFIPVAQVEGNLLDARAHDVRLKLLEKYQKAISSCMSGAELEQLRGSIHEASGNIELQAVPEAFKLVSSALSDRAMEIGAGEIESALRRCNELLEGEDVGGLREIKTLLRATYRVREQVSFDEAALSSISESTRQIEERYAQVCAEREPVIRESIEKELSETRERLKHAANPGELGTLFGGEAYRRVMDAIALLPDAGAISEAGERLNALFSDRRKELEESVRRESEKEAAIVSARMEVLAKMREGLFTRVAACRNLADLSSLADGRPGQEFREMLANLPAEARMQQESDFFAQIQQRERELTTKSVVYVPSENGYVRFGKEKFPVFGVTQLMYGPRVIPSETDPAYGQLVWENSAGRQFFPPGAQGHLVPSDLNNEETAGLIRQSRLSAERIFSISRRRVPEWKAHWRIPAHSEEVLERMSKLFLAQIASRDVISKGFVILWGEKGVGKNVLFEQFAALTGRELRIFSCNRQNTRDDLSFAYHFDPKKGTYAIDSGLVESVQTPGCLTVLDEINTLPDGVSKMLNSLGDYNRRLQLTDGRVIKMDPSGLLGAAMNPPGYIGVRDLPQELHDRARFIHVPYPAAGSAGAWRSDEAEMLAAVRPLLAGFSPEEFRAMWNEVINGKPGTAKTPRISPELQWELGALHSIVQAASKVRETYTAAQSGGDLFDLQVSLRGTSTIALELEHGGNIRKAMEEEWSSSVFTAEMKTRVDKIIASVFGGGGESAQSLKNMANEL